MSDVYDPMGINKHVVKPFLEKMGFIATITFQIVNKSRSRLYDITYSIDDITANSRKGYETFLGRYNPTSVFQHISVAATNGMNTVKFVMFDPKKQKERSLIHLHIKSKWQYENEERQDTIELAFSGYDNMKMIEHESKFIYEFKHSEKETYALCVMNTEDQSLAHEAGVFCDAGEVQYNAVPKGLEQAVTNFLAAKGKIRKVQKEAIGMVLETRIKNSSRETFLEFVNKLMKNHIDQLNYCAQFKHELSDKDCDNKLRSSLNQCYKAIQEAIKVGEPAGSSVSQGYNLAWKAFESWTAAKIALEQFQKFKNINKDTCENEDYGEVKNYGNTAIDGFDDAVTNLRAVPKVWPSELDLMSADDLYGTKLSSTKAEFEDYKEKFRACLVKKKKEEKKNSG